MRRGEIRRVRNWDYVGHEATGNRPCLIISPDWFNSTGNAIIAPLTTPGPNHENWWEIHIRATDSTCLVPDIRTVPSGSWTRQYSAMRRSTNSMTWRSPCTD